MVLPVISITFRQRNLLAKELDFFMVFAFYIIPWNLSNFRFLFRMKSIFNHGKSKDTIKPPALP